MHHTQSGDTTTEQAEPSVLNLTSSLADCGVPTKPVNNVTEDAMTADDSGEKTHPETSLATPPPGYSLCPRATTTQGYEVNGGFWHLIGGRCNAWSCASCGPIRTRSLCLRLALAEPTRFITLTCGSPKGRTPREVWDDTRRQVPELIRKIRYELGYCEYARVLEVHKSGYPHFHLLARAPFIKQESLSRWWHQLTDAFIVDIRRVNPKDHVADYLGKYLTKQLVVPFTDRRVTNSRQFFPPKQKRDKSENCFAEITREHIPLHEYIASQYPDATLEWLSSAHAVIVDDAGNAKGDVMTREFSEEQAKLRRQTAADDDYF